MKLKKTKRTHILLSNLLGLCLSVLLVSCGQHNLDVDEELGLFPTLTVRSSIQDGKFSDPPNFQLRLSKSEDSSKIAYCVNAGVTRTYNCCDPRVDGNLIDGDIVNSVAGSTDGYYCLSYYGYTNTEVSEVKNVLFQIDTSAPELSITTVKRMVQTSQYVDLSFTSNDIGYDGIFFSALNYASAQGTDCDSINSDANFTSNGIDFNKDASPDTIDMTTESESYSRNLRGKDLLQYGDNFIYFALVDSNPDPIRQSCPGMSVTLKDFNVFEFSTNGDVVPNAQGELEAVGSFNSFGGGVFVGSDNSSQLQVGIVNIIH